MDYSPLNRSDGPDCGGSATAALVALGMAFSATEAGSDRPDQ